MSTPRFTAPGGGSAQAGSGAGTGGPHRTGTAGSRSAPLPGPRTTLGSDSGHRGRSPDLPPGEVFPALPPGGG
ncbi:hypothetical protein ABZ805_28470 [Saccharopolyspora sp. NPDC047091]|uniref:hypothetical protein n=1 Tax=Saccharopolyspora sp. NPDC047091 TaxID=3155924 RepID=UPI0033CFD7E0